MAETHDAAAKEKDKDVEKQLESNLSIEAIKKLTKIEAEAMTEPMLRAHVNKLAATLPDGNPFNTRVARFSSKYSAAARLGTIQMQLNNPVLAQSMANPAAKSEAIYQGALKVATKAKAKKSAEKSASAVNKPAAKKTPAVKKSAAKKTPAVKKSAVDKNGNWKYSVTKSLEERVERMHEGSFRRTVLEALRKFGEASVEKIASSTKLEKSVVYGCLTKCEVAGFAKRA